MSVHPGVAELKAALAGRPKNLPIAARRAGFEAIMAADAPPADTRITPLEFAPGLTGEMVVADGADAGAILLWLHGGQFILGSAASYRGFAARVSAAAGVAVVTPDYRLAPEHVFPAAHDDAAAALDWAARQVSPGRLAVGGDSAGANLALGAVQAQANGRVAALWLLSPWLDLTGATASITERAPRDPFVDPAEMPEVVRRYLGLASPHDPRASPLFGPLAGLPPALVQVGQDEALFDDAARFAQRAGRVMFQEWAAMIHVWPLFANRLPEGGQAIAQAGLFLRAALFET